MSTRNERNWRTITMAGAGLILAFALHALVAVNPAAAAMDTPHSNNVTCAECHTAQSGTWWTDQGGAGGVCGTCHYPSSPYPDAKIHMTTTDYGSVQLQCTVCHDPHYQRQLRNWRTATPSSYITTGVNTGVTATTLTKTGAGWDAAENEGLGEWAGMILVPNTTYVQYAYKILSNTTDTITIDTTLSGNINLAYVTPNTSTFGITYGGFVRQAINARSVKFYRKKGTNSFADNNASVDGVCQVCHTQTPVFNVSGSLNGGNHPLDKAETDCTTCHSHTNADGGFLVKCNKCHGFPPTTTGLGGTTGLAAYDDPPTLGTGSGTTGKHQKHAVEKAYACENCHTDYAMDEYATRKIDIGFSNFGLYQKGNYNGQADVTYFGQNGTTVTTPPTGAKTCSNVYCHSTVQSGADGTGVPTYNPVVWDSASPMICGSCHKGRTTDATTMDTGSHTPHLGLSGVVCDTCHAGNTHVNGSINVTVGAYTSGGAPQNGFGTCSTAACHTNVQANGGGAGTTVTTPVWGTATACGACHKGRKTDATTMDTGSHTTHLTYTGIDCANCHSGAGDGTASHPDDNIQVVFNAFSGSGSYSDMPTNTPGTGYGACSTTYCHSTSKDGIVATGDLPAGYSGSHFTSADWGGVVSCGSCHGKTAAVAGTPDYTSVGTGQATSNTHASHVNQASDCAICHNDTTTTGTSIIGDLHVNKAADVRIANAYDNTDTNKANNYTATVGQKTCSAVYCHDPGNTGVVSPGWGGSLPDTAQCDSCHGGNRSAAAAPGQGPMTTGKHTAHIANSDTNLGSFACGRCHSGTVTTGDDRTITGTKHTNKAKDVEYDALNSGAANNTCTTVYCHSDGKAGYNDQVLATAWSSGAALNCTGCHGDNGSSSFGEPDYASTGGGADRANSHGIAAHVSAAGDCAKCHTSTSTTGTSITGSLHIDKTLDVTIGSALDTDANPANNYTPGVGNKTCSAFTCHGSGSPKWGGNTTNASCTKCHGKPTAPGSYTLNDAAPGAAGTGIDTGGSSANTDAQVGAHRAHLEANHTYSVAIACNECHNVPGAFTSNGHVYDGTNDTTKAVAEVPLGGTLANTNDRSVPGTPTYAASTCSNVYCHDYQRFKNGYADDGTAPNADRTPTWNSPLLAGTQSDCHQCHGFPPAPGHPADSDCKKCHTHVNATNDGFRPLNDPGYELHMNGQVNGGGCDSCHGNPPTTATYSVTSPSTGLVGTALGSGDTGATSPLSPGAHNKHTNSNPVNGRGMTCDACHTGTDMSTTTTGKTIDMGFVTNSTTFPGFNASASATTGTFTGYNNLSNTFSWNAANTGTTVNTAPNYNNQCSNLYCHGGGTTGKGALTGGSNQTPSWVGTNQAVCGTCHGGSAYNTASANPPTTGAHTMHADSDGYLGLACNQCHASTADITHVNGNVAWSLATGNARFGGSATYNGNASGATGGLAPSAGYQACNNIYCHSIVQTTSGGALTADTADYKQPNWGTDVGNLTCASCHGNPSASGGHLKHAGATSGQYSFACTDCHNAQVPPANTGVHANGAVNTAIATPWGTATYNGDTTPGNGFTGSTCSNTYCHSIGIGGTSQAGETRTVQANTSINWNSNTACYSCHGNGTDDSRPNYPSNDAGYQNKKNSHQLTKHASMTCDKCHNATTKDGTTIADADRANHVNRTYNVNGTGSIPYTFTYSYNVSGGSCATGYCHGPASPAWGTTGSLTCNMCHQSQGAGGTASYAPMHQKHVDVTNFYNFSCEMCHALGNTTKGNVTHVGGKATGNNPDVDPVGANQYAEIRFRDNGATWTTGQTYNGSSVNTYKFRTLYTSPYGAAAPTPTYVDGTASASDSVNSTITYTTTGSSCGTVWCHSNANPVNGTNSYTSIAWNGTAGCGACHKTQDTAANMAAAGTPQPLSAPHVQHIATDRYGQNTNFTCNACHSATASNNTTISTYAEHVDAQKDVSFNTFAYSSATYPDYATGCSNTYCHSQGTNATTPAHTAIQWTGTMDIECDSCHGGNSTSTTTIGKGKIATNAHAAHTDDSGNKVGFNIGCAECHGATVSADRTLASRVYHVNKSLNIRFDNGTRVKNGDAPTYNSLSAQSTVAGGATATPGAQAACSNVYCHSVGNLSDTTGNGTVVAVGTPSVSFITLNWNTGTIGCSNCHGESATSKAHPVYATGAAGSTTANSHVSHVEGQSYSCDTCHSTTTSDTNIPPTTVTASGAHLNRVETVSIKTIGGLNGTWDGAVTFKTCTATYCHGTGASPKWGAGASATTCNSCHQSQGAGGTASYAPKHQKHVDTAGYDLSCELCHAVTGTAHAQGPASGTNPGGDAVDANQTTQISFTSLSSGAWTTGAAYRNSASTYKYRALNESPYGAAAPTPTYTNANTNSAADLVNPSGIRYITDGSCSNLWCHSNANPLLRGAEANRNSYKAIVWNATTICTTCHRGPEVYANMAPASPTDQLSTVHALHAATDKYNFTCDECHADTMLNNSTNTLNATTGYANHVNGTKSWKFSSTIRSTAVSQANGAYSGGTCTNTYCHSKGTVLSGGTYDQATNTPVTSATWTLTSLGCNSCHGDSGNTDGMPSYTNGTPKANSHEKHVRTFSYTCVECHSGTVNASNQITTFANHISTTYNVTGTEITGGYTYNAAGGTCSTVTCHGDNSPQWGGTVSCADCHVGTGDVDDFVYGGSSSTARIDSNEWTTNGHGKAGAPLPLTCDYCHSNSTTTVNHGVGTNPYRLVNYNVGGKGWDDVCNVCHLTGSTGYNPGSGNKTSTKKIDKYHGGASHDATRNGGQYCFDCHDPHGDSNIKMVHAKPFKRSDANGLPTALPTNPVVFTNNTLATGAGGFAMTSGTFENGICNTCHTYSAASPKMVHYYATGSDNAHNTAKACTDCHRHSGDTTYNGDAFKGGGCNGCHDYDTRTGIGWGTGFTGQAVEGFGAHKKHIDHIKSRYPGVTLDPNADTFGTGAPAAICGTCHTNTAGNHTTDGGAVPRTINFGDGTYKEGGSTGFSFLFDPAATTGLPADLPRPHYNGVTGNSSSVNQKSCSAVGCHFKTTPVWSAY